MLQTCTLNIAAERLRAELQLSLHVFLAEPSKGSLDGLLAGLLGDVLDAAKEGSLKGFKGHMIWLQGLLRVSVVSEIFIMYSKWSHSEKGLYNNGLL